MAVYKLVGVRNPSFDKEGRVKHANELSDYTYYLAEKGCVGDYEDLALLSNAAYAEIFGCKRSEDTLRRKRLAIVKSRSGASPSTVLPGVMNIGKGNLGLTLSSIRQIEIRVSNMFGHPDFIALRSYYVSHTRKVESS